MRTQHGKNTCKWKSGQDTIEHSMGDMKTSCGKKKPQKMSWFLVFLAYISQIGTVSCSMDEVKSGERLMTSLQRVQWKLHSIRTVITKYSDHYCNEILNKTDVGLADLQNCAFHQNYVKDEWVRAMNPTLFELRHFRRTLLQVQGDRKVLSPYFLAKISTFIQDEENIMSDAIRAATEICVKNQVKTHETKKIEQQLKKYAHKLFTTTESVSVTDTEKMPSLSTGVPISASFRVDEWLLLTTDSTVKMNGSNEKAMTTKNDETKLISGRCQDVGASTCKGEYNVDDSFSAGERNPGSSTVVGTPQFPTTERLERVMITTSKKYTTDKTKQRESSLKTRASSKPPKINSNLTSDVQLTGMNYEWGWNDNWSLLDTNWSDFNGDGCNEEYAESDCRLGIVESYEVNFNETLAENEPQDWEEPLSSGEEVCLNCSVAPNFNSKMNMTSRVDMIDIIEDRNTSDSIPTMSYLNETISNQNAMSHSKRTISNSNAMTSYRNESMTYWNRLTTNWNTSTTYWNGSTKYWNATPTDQNISTPTGHNMSKPVIASGASTANSYDDYAEPVNCSNNDGEFQACGDLEDHSILPLGKPT